jgi:hypothetical protein
MSIDIIFSLLLAIATGAIYYFFEPTVAPHQHMALLELIYVASFFAVTTDYAVMTRIDPFESHILYCLFILAMAVLGVVFAVDNIYYTVFLLGELTAGAKGPRYALLLIRCLSLIPGLYLYAQIWLGAFCSRGAQLAESLKLGSAGQLAILSERDLDHIHLNQAYAEIKTVRPNHVDGLINKRRFLFDRVSLLPVEAELIEQRFTKLIQKSPAGHYCGICQLGFSDGQKVSSIGCTHPFHQKCIYGRMSTRAECAICKMDYREVLLRSVRNFPH